MDFEGKFDQTQMLSKVHEVNEIAELMLTRLRENAHSDAQKATLEHIETVVNLQRKVINILVELNCDVFDRLEELLEKINK